MKKRILFLAVVMCLCVLVSSALAACTNGAADKGTTQTITDMAGRTVEIPTNIERVACQSSTCEAAIISLEKADLLVGTTDYTEEDSYAFKLFPELSKVAKLSDDMSIEEMLKRKVQVVFVKDENKISKYEEAGLPVIYVELDTVAGTKEGLKIIGKAIGVEEAAQKCVDYINNMEQLVKERFSGTNAISFSAYYSRAKYANSNLLTTYAAGHIYSEWIGLSGGAVITKDMALAETKGGVMINGEELISANPDIIFVGGYYRNSVYQNALDGEYGEMLNAIKNQNIYVIPMSVTDWSVGSCELGLTMLWCAQKVAPDLFSDINMVDEVVNFYKDVSNRVVSKELASSILNSEYNS